MKFYSLLKHTKTNYTSSHFGIDVIEDPNCLQTWQLNDFTKELMSEAWVKKFNAWAEHNLPKQPAMYMVGNTLIAHPTLVRELRERFIAPDASQWGLVL